MRQAHDLVASSQVGRRTYAEEPAQRRVGRKPLAPGNLLQLTHIVKSRLQPFDESLTPQKDLPPDMPLG